MTGTGILAGLAFLSCGLTLWQWLVARRFPLHQRSAGVPSGASPAPAITLFKPLKGCDEFTEACLRSWLQQQYAGELQFLFAVAREDDPALPIVQKLLAELPDRDAQLVVCKEQRGSNPKVSKLIQLEPLAKHPVWVLSDADVLAPADCLTNLVNPFQAERVGIVTCFYRASPPNGMAMRWEAVAINTDFWSQVLQARSLGPLRFALGATLAVRREALAGAGGFAALANCLADDFELGRRVTASGWQIELCPVVTGCRESPRGWRATWRHQLRWARTISACEPGPYFASILGNATLWPVLWLALGHGRWVWPGAILCLATRLLVAADLQRRLTRSRSWLPWLWLVPLKDALQFAVWLTSYFGNEVEWRGERYRVRANGILVKSAR